MHAAPDPFTTESQKVFTDHDKASKDWCDDDTVSTIIRHIADIDLWDKEKPFCLNLPLPEGQPKSNFVGSNHAGTPICNVRGRESDFTLNQHGFAFSKLPPFTGCFEDTAEIENGYLREMEEFLKKETKADEVFIFDYTAGLISELLVPVNLDWTFGLHSQRRRREPFGSDYKGLFYRPPGTVAHVDQTPAAALKRLRLHFGQDGENRVKGRMQLINVWRPTFGPVEDCPMAVCDSRTLEENELVAADLVYPHYVGEKYDIRWSEKHRWYYLRNMMDDECLLIKNFDTAIDGRARFCAHCAFIDPTTPKGARPRESIEVRAMVFHHDHDIHLAAS